MPGLIERMQQAYVVAPERGFSPGFVNGIIRDRGGACEFCAATEGLDICDWPVWKYGRDVYGCLRVGDKVKRITDKNEGRAPAEVLELKCGSLTSKRGKVTAAIRITLLIRGNQRTIQVYQRSPVRVLRDSNCERVCCENCRVERGPGATFCRQHWKGWEAVA